MTTLNRSPLEKTTELNKSCNLTASPQFSSGTKHSSTKSSVTSGTPGIRQRKPAKRAVKKRIIQPDSSDSDMVILDSDSDFDWSEQHTPASRSKKKWSVSKAKRDVSPGSPVFSTASSRVRHASVDDDTAAISQQAVHDDSLNMKCVITDCHATNVTKSPLCDLQKQKAWWTPSVTAPNLAVSSETVNSASTSTASTNRGNLCL